MVELIGEGRACIPVGLTLLAKKHAKDTNPYKLYYIIEFPVLY